MHGGKPKIRGVSFLYVIVPWISLLYDLKARIDTQQAYDFSQKSFQTSLHSWFSF